MYDPQLLVAQADKKATPLTGFSRFFATDSNYRYEEAADLYIQAANLYRLQKQGIMAGRTFEKASSCQFQADSNDEAANTLIEAFKSYRKDSPSDSARVLNQAITIFIQKGQFRRAANFKMDLASIYETDLSDTKIFDAIKAYQEAGDWYSNDQAEALSNKAYIKAADLNAVMENYLEAASLYESVAKKSLNNNLSKWSLKDYFFKAVLCYMASNDIVATEKALNAFANWDSNFQTTREFQLLNDIIISIKENDQQLFTDKLYEYDQFSKLDKWKTSIFLKIKTLISEADDDIL
ncbi:alpha-soluble NSF attachment protein SEC17 [Ascoidea rubescens DSM 1968]|uniref:TPR-like protein n=1 Tax=Ascoidea rubescens DSM 1968 TaxID=1344418 RepID=A0A1D2VNT5_9ASCO|nr:TPR-like protein [Ascoidea rubescens DSM 1968]ODV63282.1 TPR-like protein [Ascoidea rubescens DSM 1968]